MAAARSLDPVLAKIRLMWVLTVWLLRNSCAAISGLVSPRAMQAARPGYGRELRRALRRLGETIDDPGSDRYMREHTAFHWALIEPAASPVMRRVVEQLWQMSERYIRLTVASQETRRTYAQHHEPLVDAMESGDAGRVRAEVVRHLSEAEEIVLGPRHGTGAET